MEIKLWLDKCLKESKEQPVFCIKLPIKVWMAVECLHLNGISVGVGTETISNSESFVVCCCFFGNPFKRLELD